MYRYCPDKVPPGFPRNGESDYSEEEGASWKDLDYSSSVYSESGSSENETTDNESNTRRVYHFSSDNGTTDSDSDCDLYENGENSHSSDVNSEIDIADLDCDLYENGENSHSSEVNSETDISDSDCDLYENDENSHSSDVNSETDISDSDCDLYENGEISYSSDVNSETDISDSDAEEPTNEQQIFLSFYNKVNEVLMLRQDEPAFASSVTLAAVTITRSYQGVVKGKLQADVDYSRLEFCLGYLLRYAPCHTALVRHFTTQLLLTSPPDEVSSKLSQKELNVVFLGGGPGNDAVGFLSALYGTHASLWNLNITIVDKMRGWKQIVEETFAQVREGSCGQASLVCEDVNVMETFKECDVGSDITELDETLLNSDFVFMVKFLSHVPDEDKETVLENVARRMSSDSLLIYIDSPFPTATFSKVKTLIPILRYPSTKFIFDIKQSRFAIGNIKRSTAEVHVYKKVF